MPVPTAVVRNVVTGVSSIPWTIFPMVLAVAGATRTRSACPERSPHISTCSTFPVISVTTGLPVANSMEYAPTISCAFSVITPNTSAPWRISSLASLTHSTAAIEPVMASTIFFPSRELPLVPRISSAGCMGANTILHILVCSHRGALSDFPAHGYPSILPGPTRII